MKPSGDDALPHDEARTDCLNKHIVLRRTTWISALNGHPRAYMTVLHELAHIALNHRGLRSRAIGTDLRAANLFDVRLEESEAKRFAGMLAAPHYLVSDHKDHLQIACDFQISPEAAQIRKHQSDKIERQKSGQLRSLPSVVTKFLTEKQAEGHEIKSLSLVVNPTTRTEPCETWNELYHEHFPCKGCKNYTVLRRGSEILCETCGDSCGCS